jgi:hypothetical protein
MITLANPASVTCAHAALRDALLPKLIRGEIRVKEVVKALICAAFLEESNPSPGVGERGYYTIAEDGQLK